MKSTGISVLVASMVASFAPAASAVVLTFDDLVSNIFFSADYQGFRFGNNVAATNDWFVDPGPSPLYPRASVATAIGFNPLVPVGNIDQLESMPITMANGADFFLAGAFFSGYATDSIGGTALVSFKLYNNNALVGTTGTLTPNHVAAVFLSTGALAAIAIDAFTVVGPAPYFLMDNLNVTPVPEPATFGMMALGLVGMGAMVRRQKKE